MAEYTEKNQTSIHEITNAIQIYGSNTEQMQHDTNILKQLAESMEKEITREA